MHLLSSALSISFILGSFVWSVDGTPVSADSSQTEDSHATLPALQPALEKSNVPPVPAGADFVMTIDGGIEEVGPNFQRFFNRLGTQCMDSWEGAMERRIVIWPNPISHLVDDHFDDRVFQWKSFKLSAAPGKTSTYCPHTSPCVGTFVPKTAVYWEWKIRSAAMNKDINIRYNRQYWIAVGDGNAPVRKGIKNELESVSHLALSYWGDHLDGYPEVLNVDAHPTDEAPMTTELGQNCVPQLRGFDWGPWTL
ncbi:hypothetical protein EV360DRAFT_91021, partial [Lentinula raphanica]